MGPLKRLIGSLIFFIYRGGNEGERRRKALKTSPKLPKASQRLPKDSPNVCQNSPKPPQSLPKAFPKPPPKTGSSCYSMKSATATSKRAPSAIR